MLYTVESLKSNLYQDCVYLRTLFWSVFNVLHWWELWKKCTRCRTIWASTITNEKLFSIRFCNRKFDEEGVWINLETLYAFSFFRSFFVTDIIYRFSLLLLSESLMVLFQGYYLSLPSIQLLLLAPDGFGYRWPMGLVLVAGSKSFATVSSALTDLCICHWLASVQHQVDWW